MRRKLVVVVAAPALVAVALAVHGALGSWSSVADLGQASNLVRVHHQINDLADALQQERDVTAVYVSSGRGLLEDEVDAARTDTDTAVAKYRTAIGGLDVTDTPGLPEVVADTDDALDGLKPVRSAVTNANLTEGAIRATYTEAVATLFSLVTFDPDGTDPRLAGDLRVLGDMFKVKEYASQARAELGAVLAAGAFGTGTLQDFTGILARQQDAVDALLADASGDQRTRYANAVQGAAVSQVGTDQAGALEQAGAERLTIDPTVSFAAATEKLNLLRDAQTQLLSGAIDAVDGLQDDALVAAWVTIGVFALLILLAVALSAVVGRSLSRSLRRLRTSAVHVAEELTRRPSGAEQAASPLPRVEIDTGDEIGEVARAFDSVTSACARLVEDRSELRGSMNAGFVNLARRNQLCAERILRALDEWEQDELDTERLRRLFVIDHLATRMRRTDDSLMVLAGAQTVGRRAGPTALDEVVGAALSEVEFYTRVVRRSAGDGVVVAGHAVPHVVHLLSELLDNATTFSPPSTQVTVGFMRTPSDPGAVVVLVRDHGVGLSQERLAELNRRVTAPEDVDGSTVRNMGLIVVGRLAARHGIEVRLGPTDGGGVTATVVLPGTILVGEEPQEYQRMPRTAPANGRQDSTGVGEIAPYLPGRALDLRDAVAMRRQQRRRRVNPTDN
ncbi:signal transduction histidine kinase [Actinophytocola oryzae]|uniref:histidine kinase n=1 Tax=Actinophytocola oryzae TaxID=502181 RepID=A0A4R7USY0_9PSEU|nr:signal transduction histidine kinase [Actinophytocola oryzae]